MGTDSAIEWTNHTWNPWVGCSHAGTPECDHCYARREMTRYGQDFDTVARTAAGTWKNPYRWLRTLEAAYAAGHAAQDRTAFVFTCSWGDFFHPAADAWRAEAWEEIRETSRDYAAGGVLGALPKAHLTWLILTKRTDRIADCLPPDWGEGWPHVWLGATVGHPDSLHRVDELLRVPCRAGRFVSCEPLLGPLEFSDVTHRSYCVSRLGRPAFEGIDWVIAGCESGPNARPSDPDWFRGLRNQCVSAGVPFMLKQMTLNGKLVKLPLLDGVEHNGMPEVRHA